MGWDYPPGVTGFEPQIVGGDEVEDYSPQTCRVCDFEDEVRVLRVFEDHQVVEHWECPECGTEQATDVTAEWEGER